LNYVHVHTIKKTRKPSHLTHSRTLSRKPLLHTTWLESH